LEVCSFALRTLTIRTVDGILYTFVPGICSAIADHISLANERPVAMVRVLASGAAIKRIITMPMYSLAFVQQID
jgi:hypothetical protein